MKIRVIEVEQPIGTFYLGVLPAEVIIRVGEVRERKFDSNSLESFGGVQRPESKKRIREISQYCFDPDATFPTPIIIAIDNNSGCVLTGEELEFDEQKKIGEIIDGQHRIGGLKYSGLQNKFKLPITFMFDLTEEEKAYVFSTINSTQTKVPKSLIYDLFELSEGRSPQKTCHEIARLLNSDSDSPFYTRLKMLGKKQTDYASLSQGTFVQYLLGLISKDPQKDSIDIKNNRKLEEDDTFPLRSYFIQAKDEVIYKIIFNLFSGVKQVFPNEWTDFNTYILSKTTGFGAILLAFKELYRIGRNKNDLSKDYFSEQFEKFKNFVIAQNIQLTSTRFASSAAGAQDLARCMLEAIRE